MLQAVIAVFLCAVGAGVLYLLYRLSKGALVHAGRVSVPIPERQPEDIEVSGELGADGLVFLFAEDFVKPRVSGPTALPRDKAYAPISGEELDPEHWTLWLLYASLCDMHEQKSLEFRMVERDATFLPPFPQKRWEMQVVQRTPFPSTPVLGALEVAFDLLRQRQQQRVAQSREEPGEAWFALDEIIERALRAMRQEISLWERAGVFGDLRNYVASTLVAQGYLIPPGRETWLDRSRSKKPRANPEALALLVGPKTEVKQRVEAFRLKFGSAYARGEMDAEEARPAIRDADPALVTGEGDMEDMPLDDCLRLSIYEVLISLRQLEPSGDAGI